MKPQDFFISVTDFFSVLLPGAMLTWFLNGVFYSHSLSTLFPIPDSENGRWGAFLVVAYVLGNLIFMLATFLDKFYDKNLRKLHYNDPYDLTYKTARNIQWKYINSDDIATELAQNGIISISQNYDWRTNLKREIFNTFKWVQHYFQFKHPEALAEIKRTEADSKFFRSLVITFLLITFFLFWEQELLYGTTSLLFGLLSFYRYGELRFKSTEKAYQLLITYENSETIKRHNIGINAIKIQSLKTGLTQESIKMFRSKIDQISELGNLELQELIFEKGTYNNILLKNYSTENWYCISGKGDYFLKENGTENKSNIIENCILPIFANSEFRIVNPHNDPLIFLINKNKFN